MAIRSSKFYTLFSVTLIFFDNVLATAAAVTFTLHLPSLINFICTEGGVELFCLLFQDMFKVIKPWKASDLALIEMVIGRLKLKVCLLTLAFFPNCCYCCIASMEPIEFIVTDDYWMFIREAELGQLLLGISASSDKTFLCALISCLLPIASFLISLIWACFYAFCQFLSSLACCLCLISLAFFNWALKLGFILLLLIS